MLKSVNPAELWSRNTSQAFAQASQDKDEGLHIPYVGAALSGQNTLADLQEFCSGNLGHSHHNYALG